MSEASGKTISPETLSLLLHWTLYLLNRQRLDVLPVRSSDLLHHGLPGSDLYRENLEHALPDGPSFKGHKPSRGCHARI